MHEQCFALTFELLLGRLGGIPKAVLERNFMKVLKPEIQASLRLLRLRGLGESIKLAQMIEDKKKKKGLIIAI